MSSKTKIVVLRMKELLYTAAFVGLGILLLFLLIYMFSDKKEAKEETSKASYIPGVYVSAMVLNGQAVDIAVTVDKDHINAIEFKQLEESMTVTYPLISPALEDLKAQILEKQSLSGLELDPSMTHTQNALLTTIQNALAPAYN